MLEATSPIWVPYAIIGGAVVVGALTYYATLASKEISNWGTRWAGPRQIPSLEELGWPTPPGPGDLGPPNIPPKAPTWMKWGAGCLVACPQIAQIIEEFQKHEEWIEEFERKSNQSSTNSTVNVQAPATQPNPSNSNNPGLQGRPEQGGGPTNSSGLLPRSTNPVGYEKSGAAIYCWGACSN